MQALLATNIVRPQIILPEKGESLRPALWTTCRQSTPSRVFESGLSSMMVRRLLSALRKIISRKLIYKSHNNQPSPSMVLLQRRLHCVDQQALEAAADRAWKLGLSQGNKPEKYFFDYSDARAVMFVGAALLHIVQQQSPYLSLKETELHRFLPDSGRRDLWRAHQAWLAIDCHGVRDVELAYAILAGLASELLDANIVGVYIPREQAFAPHDSSLYSSLKHLASSREFILK